MKPIISPLYMQHLIISLIIYCKVKTHKLKNVMETVTLAYDVYETTETDQEKCPIVFLHGLFFNKYMLKGLSKKLCEATKRKVFCPDLRNHDQSPFREECDIYLMVEDIKNFIKERELEKVAFVCHSFSCSIAYLILLDQPDVVERIVMIDHPPFIDFTEYSFKENVYPQFAAQNRFLATLDTKLSLAEAKNKILALSECATSGQKIFLQKVAYELIKISNRFDWKTNHKFLIEKYKDRHFTPQERGSSNHEILIIRCKDSIRVTDKKFESVRKYNPNAKLITINDCTHLLMFEKEEEFIKTVKEFLSEDK